MLQLPGSLHSGYKSSATKPNYHIRLSNIFLAESYHSTPLLIQASSVSNSIFLSCSRKFKSASVFSKRWSDLTHAGGVGPEYK
jgi:hypothetical protein